MGHGRVMIRPRTASRCAGRGRFATSGGAAFRSHLADPELPFPGHLDLEESIETLRERRRSEPLRGREDPWHRDALTACSTRVPGDARSDVRRKVVAERRRAERTRDREDGRPLRGARAGVVDDDRPTGTELRFDESALPLGGLPVVAEEVPRHQGVRAREPQPVERALPSSLEADQDDDLWPPGIARSLWPTLVHGRSMPRSGRARCRKAYAVTDRDTSIRLVAGGHQAGAPVGHVMRTRSRRAIAHVSRREVCAGRVCGRRATGWER